MGFNKPRHYRAAIQVDHGNVPTGLLAQHLYLAQRHNLAPLHQHGIHHRLLRVHGQYRAIKKELGRWRRRVKPAMHARHGQHDQGNDDHQYPQSGFLHSVSLTAGPAFSPLFVIAQTLPVRSRENKRDCHRLSIPTAVYHHIFK